MVHKSLLDASFWADICTDDPCSHGPSYYVGGKVSDATRENLPCIAAERATIVVGLVDSPEAVPLVGTERWDCRNSGWESDHTRCRDKEYNKIGCGDGADKY